MMLLLEVKHLRERLDEAVAKRQLAPPPAPWWVVGEAEGRAMLAGAAPEWVEEFAPGLDITPGTWRAFRATCWANHPEAVWGASSTLRAEWERIYADTGQQGPCRPPSCGTTNGSRVSYRASLPRSNAMSRAAGWRGPARRADKPRPKAPACFPLCRVSALSLCLLPGLLLAGQAPCRPRAQRWAQVGGQSGRAAMKARGRLTSHEPGVSTGSSSAAWSI